MLAIHCLARYSSFRQDRKVTRIAGFFSGYSPIFSTVFSLAKPLTDFNKLDEPDEYIHGLLSTESHTVSCSESHFVIICSLIKHTGLEFVDFSFFGLEKLEI